MWNISFKLVKIFWYIVIVYGLWTLNIFSLYNQKCTQEAIFVKINRQVWHIMDTQQSTQIYGSYKPNFDENDNQYLYNKKNICKWQKFGSIFGPTKVFAQETEIKIRSILPNPKWRDVGNEEIVIYSSEYIKLDNWYYFLIWDRKKTISWVLRAWEETLFKWNYGFTNDDKCVSIVRFDIVYDRFCYPKPKEWVVYKQSNSNIASVRKSTTNQDLQELKLYKEYTKALEGYLKNNWSVLYQNSEVKTYKNKFQNYKNLIDNWSDIYVFDFNTQQEQKSYLNTNEKIMSVLIWNEMLNKYKQIKHDYFQYLQDNS